MVSLKVLNNCKAKVQYLPVATIARGMKIAVGGTTRNFNGIIILMA